MSDRTKSLEGYREQLSRWQELASRADEFAGTCHPDIGDLGTEVYDALTTPFPDTTYKFDESSGGLVEIGAHSPLDTVPTELSCTDVSVCLEDPVTQLKKLIKHGDNATREALKRELISYVEAEESDFGVALDMMNEAGEIQSPLNGEMLRSYQSLDYAYKTASGELSEIKKEVELGNIIGATDHYLYGRDVASAISVYWDGQNAIQDVENIERTKEIGFLLASIGVTIGVGTVAGSVLAKSELSAAAEARLAGITVAELDAAALAKLNMARAAARLLPPAAFLTTSRTLHNNLYNEKMTVGKNVFEWAIDYAFVLGMFEYLGLSVRGFDDLFGDWLPGMAKEHLALSAGFATYTPMENIGRQTFSGKPFSQELFIQQTATAKALIEQQITLVMLQVGGYPLKKAMKPLEKAAMKRALEKAYNEYRELVQEQMDVLGDKICEDVDAAAMHGDSPAPFGMFGIWASVDAAIEAAKNWSARLKSARSHGAKDAILAEIKTNPDKSDIRLLEEAAISGMADAKNALITLAKGGRADAFEFVSTHGTVADLLEIARARDGDTSISIEARKKLAEIATYDLEAVAALKTLIIEEVSGAWEDAANLDVSEYSETILESPETVFALEPLAAVNNRLALMFAGADIGKIRDGILTTPATRADGFRMLRIFAETGNVDAFNELRDAAREGDADAIAQMKSFRINMFRAYMQTNKNYVDRVGEVAEFDNDGFKTELAQLAKSDGKVTGPAARAIMASLEGAGIDFSRATTHDSHAKYLEAEVARNVADGTMRTEPPQVSPAELAALSTRAYSGDMGALDELAVHAISDPLAAEHLCVLSRSGGENTMYTLSLAKKLDIRRLAIRAAGGDVRAINALHKLYQVRNNTAGEALMFQQIEPLLDIIRLDERPHSIADAIDALAILRRHNNTKASLALKSMDNAIVDEIARRAESDPEYIYTLAHLDSAKHPRANDALQKLADAGSGDARFIFSFKADRHGMGWNPATDTSGVTPFNIERIRETSPAVAEIIPRAEACDGSALWAIDVFARDDWMLRRFLTTVDISGSAAEVRDLQLGGKVGAADLLGQKGNPSAGAIMTTISNADLKTAAEGGSLVSYRILSRRAEIDAGANTQFDSLDFSDAAGRANRGNREVVSFLLEIMDSSNPDLPATKAFLSIDPTKFGKMVEQGGEDAADAAEAIMLLDTGGNVQAGQLKLVMKLDSIIEAAINDPTRCDLLGSLFADGHPEALSALEKLKARGVKRAGREITNASVDKLAEMWEEGNLQTGSTVRRAAGLGNLSANEALLDRAGSGSGHNLDQAKRLDLSGLGKVASHPSLEWLGGEGGQTARDARQAYELLVRYEEIGHPRASGEIRSAGISGNSFAARHFLEGEARTLADMVGRAPAQFGRILSLAAAPMSGNTSALDAATAMIPSICALSRQPGNGIGRILREFELGELPNLAHKRDHRAMTIIDNLRKVGNKEAIGFFRPPGGQDTSGGTAN